MVRIYQKCWSYIQLARLDKPIGIWLVFFPTVWSLIWVSLDYHTFFQNIGWLFLGAVSARSVGCVINDGWDRDLDKYVQRTSQRPFAVGKISKLGFFLCLLFCGSLALSILLQFNKTTIMWGLAVIPLIVLYPLMKRWTYWPQLFLALTFNWGVLLASTAVTSSISLETLALYIGCACWTLAYDTIYGHQDADDDRRIGIKSTALRFGKKTKSYVTGFVALFFGILCLLFYQRSYGFSKVLSLFGIWLYELRLISKWKPDQMESSRQTFLRQNTIGWGITLVLFLFEILPLLWTCIPFYFL